MYLVTGATGLVGNNVVRQLLARRERVRVLARGSSSVPRALQGLPVETVNGDVRDPEAVRKAVEGAEVVIHSAGHVHIGWSQAETHWAVNVQGTRNVAEAVRRTGARLVYVSSVNALGVSGKNAPVSEDDALPGIVPCPYVVTKREAEKFVLELSAVGLDAVVVNPSFMLGPWDWKPSSGRMMLEIAKRFAPLAPSGSFNVCDVRDVSNGILAAVKHGRTGRRYILGGRDLRYFDLWKEIARTAGTAGPWFPAGPMQRYSGGWLGDLWYRLTGSEPDLNSAAVAMSSRHHRFRSDRAIAELGYSCRPLEETLRDTWQWFLDYGYVVPRVAAKEAVVARA